MHPKESQLRALAPKESIGLILFGSRARHDDRPDSDWDLGLLLGVRVPRSEYLRIQLDVTDRATELLDAPVDVVILDEASPGLRFVVAREGRPIAMDPDDWAWFQVRAASEYPDWCRFMAPFEDAAAAGLRSLAGKEDA